MRNHLTPHEKEDLEKFEALEFAKENDLWIKDFYNLGNQTLIGGHEHTLTLDIKKSIVYKSNNLANSKNLISKLIESVSVHNKLFDLTRYEFIGFTGLDNGENRAPLIELIYKQNYIKIITKKESNILKILNH